MYCVNCGQTLSTLSVADDIKAVKYADDIVSDLVYLCNRCNSCFRVEEAIVINKSFKIRKISPRETMRIKGIKSIFPLANASTGSKEHYLVITSEVLSNGTVDEIGITLTSYDFFNLMKACTVNYIVNKDFEDEVAESYSNPYIPLDDILYVTKLTRELSTSVGIINYIFYNAKVIKK